MPKLKVIFAGAGEFGLPTLRALIEHHDVVAIYSQPDRPAGRGRKLTPTPIAQFALNGILDHPPQIPLIRTPDLNAESLPECDVLVVIAFGQKIAPHITAHPKFGAINLHASRLPKYRGAAPIHRAILGGETVTGNSIIRLAPKMDAGAVLAMSELPIGDLETTGELHDRLAADGPILALKVLNDLATGTAVEIEQDHAAATIAKKLSRETALLDFSRPADELARTIRGLYPWPGCRVTLKDKDGKDIARLTLSRARVIPAPSSSSPSIPPGMLDAQGHISCGTNNLEIVELQPEGGKPMPLKSFQNGKPWPNGGQLVPLA